MSDKINIIYSRYDVLQYINLVYLQHDKAMIEYQSNNDTNIKVSFVGCFKSNFETNIHIMPSSHYIYIYLYFTVDMPILMIVVL